MRFSSSQARMFCRTIHRELSYFFSGMVLIYAISGLYMNHRDTINPHYTITRTELRLGTLPSAEELNRTAVEALLARAGVSERYTKHYFPQAGHLKVFLKGGSSFEANLTTGEALYESLRRRPIVSTMTTLHYNPGRWWTWFADTFAVGLIVITLSGILMLKGRRGLWGRGGIELAAGILLPIILLLLS